MHTQLRPTQSVLDIAHRLEEEGFEAWCVGGAIRDALLGHPALDWDLATSARPEQVQKLFGKKRTIPVGIEFGTVTVLDPDGVPHEITTFRRDVHTDGRHAVVEFGASMDDDLARRDFTINAIAYRPRTDELRDPFRGRADLDARVIRAVGDPGQRMEEDRLRALRAIRFAARFGFMIESATLVAVMRSAPYLGRLSAERVQQELVKTMEQVTRPSEALRLWRETGALAVLIPSLATVSDVALDTLDQLPLASAGGRRATQRTSNRLAALVLDLSPAEVRDVFSGLRFSKRETSWSVQLSDSWHRVARQMASALSAQQPPSDEAVRRWLAALGRLRAGAFLRLAIARWESVRRRGGDAPSARAVRALHRRFERAIYTEPLELADLAIGGDDLRRAGIPAGPIYAKILHALLEHVLEEPARNTTALLLAEVPRIMARLEQQTASTVTPSTER